MKPVTFIFYHIRGIIQVAAEIFFTEKHAFLTVGSSDFVSRKIIDRCNTMCYDNEKEILMIMQVAKWGNSQGIRMDKRALQSLGLRIGDTVEISQKGEEIIITPTHGIDWYMQDHERPDDGWEHIEPEGREIW
jgi:antitoxin MazE